MYGVKATINEFLPPGGYFAGRNPIELDTSGVDGRVPSGETVHGVDELLLLDGDRQRHRLSAFQPENTSGVAVQELRPHLVLQRNVGQLAEDPLQGQAHRKVTGVEDLVGAAGIRV